MLALRYDAFLRLGTAIARTLWVRAAIISGFSCIERKPMALLLGDRVPNFQQTSSDGTIDRILQRTVRYAAVIGLLHSGQTDAGEPHSGQTPDSL